MVQKLKTTNDWRRAGKPPINLDALENTAPTKSMVLGTIHRIQDILREIQDTESIKNDQLFTELLNLVIDVNNMVDRL